MKVVSYTKCTDVPLYQVCKLELLSKQGIYIANNLDGADSTNGST